jgi:serine protease inhibitor
MERPMIMPGLEKPDSAPPAETGGTTRDVPDYAAFGLDLFRRLADAQPDGNVVTSPLSAGIALSLLANGATGATLAGILQTLATGMDLRALNVANAALSGSLRSEDVEIAVANSLWMHGAPFLPEYVAESQRIYGAEVGALTSAGPINDWVSRHTRGRITQMVSDPIDPLVILLLLNAVYFKGRWQEEFRADDTRDRTFHAPSGPVERPMMSRTGHYGYLHGAGFRAARMPYRGDRFAMYVLLPDTGQSLAQLRGRLTAEAWRGWMGVFRNVKMDVVLPRWRMNLESSLNDPLREMGMADAFIGGRAALDAMLPAAYVAQEAPYVSTVLQKVFVEVNEEGTEAAAVTMVAVAGRSLVKDMVVDFIVDRPFVFAIRDDQTGALLFVGQVNDPVTE